MGKRFCEALYSECCPSHISHDVRAYFCQEGWLESPDMPLQSQKCKCETGSPVLDKARPTSKMASARALDILKLQQHIS